MANKSAKTPLGRLTSLGIKEVWQAALYLPDKWDNLTNVISCLDNPLQYEGRSILIQGYLGGYTTKFNSRGTPQLNGVVYDLDRRNSINYTLFGDTREFQADAVDLQNKVIYIFGEVTSFGGKAYLSKMEIIPEKWVGKFRPVYSGKPRVITPETVRDRITNLLIEGIPEAANRVAKEVDLTKEQTLQYVGLHKLSNSLERVIYRAHLPLNIQQGVKAQQALERIAAYRAIKQARSLIPTDFTPVNLPKPIDDWKPLSQGLPFSLSDVQQRAINEIVGDLKQPKPMLRLLSGDVGYGKTAVFGIASMTILRAGGRVALLMPSQTLAEQAFRELTSYWPEDKERFCLVTEDCSDKTDLAAFDYLIGTTALLFRDTGQLHLVIVDEQQKFATDQRNQMVKGGCHLLEATATCIPRSQALVQFGGFRYSVLDKPPVEKKISTKIRYAEDAKQMFADIYKTISDGYQVLVVYPKKRADEDPDGDDAKSGFISDVESSAQAWEKKFPGEVRFVHSDKKGEENELALKDMRDEKAKVLIATTVVEVGVNIPKLRRVVIVHAHRFGLSTLHQIRGRAARTGGVGYCDLFVPELPKSGIERLFILERTNNGFEVAKEDLKLRGCGDLGSGSKKQSGADESILFGRFLLPDRLEEAIKLEKRFHENFCTT